MARGAVLGWAGHVVGLVCTFFVTPVLILGLGEAAYGIWSLVIAVSGYYGLIDLGIGSATTKFAAQYLEKGDTREAQRYLSAAFSTYLKLAAAVVVIAAAIGLVLPYVVRVDDYGKLSLFALTLFCGGNAACSFVGTTARSYILAVRGFAFDGLARIIAQLVTAVGMIAIVKAGWGLVGMAMLLFALGVAREGTTMLVAWKYFEMPSLKRIDATNDLNKKMFRFGGMVVASQVVRRLTQRAGTLAGVWLGGAAAIAYYSVAETACEKSLAMAKPIGRMILPTASSAQASENERLIRRMLVIVPRMFLVIGLFMSLNLICYGKEFLSIWISPEFSEKCYPVLSILAIAIPMRTLGACFSRVLQGFGKVSSVMRIAVVEGLVLIMIGVLLAYLYGITGLASAVVVSSAVAGVVCFPIVIADARGAKPLSLMFSICAPPAMVSAMAFAAFELLDTVFEPRSYLGIAFCISILGVVSAFGSLFLCADRALREKVLRQISRIMTRSMRSSEAAS